MESEEEPRSLNEEDGLSNLEELLGIIRRLKAMGNTKQRPEGSENDSNLPELLTIVGRLKEIDEECSVRGSGRNTSHLNETLSIVGALNEMEENNGASFESEKSSTLEELLGRLKEIGNNEERSAGEAANEDRLLDTINSLEVIDDDPDFGQAGSNQECDQVATHSSLYPLPDSPECSRNDYEAGTTTAASVTMADSIRDTVCRHTALQIAAIVHGLDNGTVDNSEGSRRGPYSTSESMCTEKLKSARSTNRKRDEMSKTDSSASSHSQSRSS